MNLSFEGNGKVKLSKEDLKRLFASESFKRQLEAVRELRREIEKNHERTETDA